MPDRAYRRVIRCIRGLFRVLAIEFDIRGTEHIPADGAAVIASNHIGYLDFTFIGQAADQRHRLVRFMAKASVFGLPGIGRLMHAMGHIPVHRTSGAAAYRQAERALGRGELVGVFPEGTISRSWTLKPFKLGAARLAAAQQVPLIPMVTWGGHRLITVDGRHSVRRHVPVTVLIGPPIHPRPGQDPAAVNEILRREMSALLDRAQRDYPFHPQRSDDNWWLPAHLGGTAPDPAAAAALDRAKVKL